MMAHPIVQDLIDLAHHRDVKDIQRRLVECDSPDAVFDCELD
jgi:hypothetical protein